jgi:tetratricopeptide (TPR) repeat protein
MARSYSLESQYEQAIEYGLKAAELYEKLGNKNESARLYLQLAQLCKRQKNYQKAAEYEEKARTLLGEGEKVIKRDK